MKERIKQILSRQPGDEVISVEGWVRTKRDSKNVCFLEINDGSTVKGLQAVVDKASFDNDNLLGEVTTGAAVRCTGRLVASQGQAQSVELALETLEIVGTCPVDYPLQKKRHTIEFLREIAYLRPRTNLIGAVMRVRSTLAYAIHNFFQERGFVYVNTPLITTSDCEGAGETFQVTTLDLGKVPMSKDGDVDYSKDFFGKKASLTVSGQLEGESYALALKDIYTFGPTFRAENSNTPRHLAEFWMIEPEVAFIDKDDLMDLEEEFIKYCVQWALDNCKDDLEFLNKMIDKGLIARLEGVLKDSFVRLTYTDGIRILEEAVSNGKKFEFPVSWGMDLASEHERYLVEEHFKKPVIMNDYPKEIKAFYMKMNEDGKTVRGMDVLVPRLGEIIGGSEREADYDKLLGRINELGLNPKDYWWYLETRRFGSVPHSGFGLGFERAIQYVTGVANIRDVIPYPRYVRSADF